MKRSRRVRVEHVSMRERVFEMRVALFDCVVPLSSRHFNPRPVMNVEQSVGRIGFFGAHAEYLYCLSQINTMSMWNIAEVR